MAEERAVISAELDGAGKVVSEARKVGDALAQQARRAYVEGALRGLPGVVQAIEDARHPFRIGVQWHPEYMPQSAPQRRLFCSLVLAAAGTVAGAEADARRA